VGLVLNMVAGLLLGVVAYYVSLVFNGIAMFTFMVSATGKEKWPVGGVTWGAAERLCARACVACARVCEVSVYAKCLCTHSCMCVCWGVPFEGVRCAYVCGRVCVGMCVCVCLCM
jgi:hypothetical protein